MKTDAERKLAALVKDMVDNTDFTQEMTAQLEAKGYYQIPAFTFMKDKPAPITEGIMGKNARHLKVAGFVVAVFIVSGIMAVFINSDWTRKTCGLQQRVKSARS